MDQNQRGLFHRHSQVDTGMNVSLIFTEIQVFQLEKPCVHMLGKLNSAAKCGEKLV